MRRYAIRHETRYRYAGPVTDIACTLRLKPVDWPGQRLIDYALVVEPAGFVADERGRACHRQHLEVTGPTDALVITARATVEVDRPVPFPQADDPVIGGVRPAPHPLLDPLLDPAECLAPSPYAPFDAGIASWASPVLTPGRPILDAAFALARALHGAMRYQPGATGVETTPSQAFGRRAGVCQDFAQIMLVALRAHAVPAAYVSGYLPSGRPELQGADASHAWIMVWAGEAQGWVGIDPTNALWMAGRHIVVAVGRDYGDVAPVTGVFMGPPGGSMTAAVEVVDSGSPSPSPRA